jgi:endo-alpha-1,4-polygalactosaminidase (GH114 family)
MPNIFSCSTEWFKRLKEQQPKVVIATWKEAGGEKVSADKLNEFLEKLQKLEDGGIPIFVVDCDSCGTIAQELKITEAGEVIVFNNGVEKGRVVPTDDKIEADLSEVKSLLGTQ